MNQPISANKRRHVRYRNEESTVIHLQFSADNGREVQVTALIVNESHSGMACVYVGSESVSRGQIIQWNETANIRTPLKTIRCKQLDEDVYLLALEIAN